ncbi:uncharacterized protein MONOS_16211 [Monocercomonoides exilis]|uniref:uncharacterized protein n=1 Tax=Monocercomonoides exilis TaxID=2049356 RepID=UPI00355ACD00|nr:hypothetical protein MONOS_16211 [Monocercomonoides exilis]|eukprot:MONOS_16211.1-p1 / transcript=MONOS_16211.1 / gene=MONOS_16211 / organism=Monocercomonoides_exilis_PA203 / gene_product=unspecified product / transcript_product=unspecified product / location=Mono_scaffold01567:63-443(-) / protein_length=127 / sequence_SO=supercontig / SO=protein_coding / is_pseudo=false
MFTLLLISILSKAFAYTEYYEEDEFPDYESYEIDDSEFEDLEDDEELDEDGIPIVCGLCKWLVGKAIEYAYGKTNKQITNFLWSQCDKHPTWAHKCREVVPPLLNVVYMIVKKYGPPIICGAAHLC